jgi:selenocysteine lyase/cysteine desulfurase
MTADNHNSINGLRCFAQRAKASTVYIPVRPKDLRVESAAVMEALGPRRTSSSCRRLRFLGGARGEQRGLFAFPAQSNFSGVRHPLSWVRLAQEQGYDVLLDAAAFLPTAKLDLSVVRPEFILVSWYKLFGFPTGVGCLVARRDALARLERPWFSGGTVRAVAVGVPWHSLADGEVAFEDGTVNFLSIPDVHVGLAWLAKVGIGTVATRVRCLTGWLVERLQGMRHSNGTPMARVYGPDGTEDRGGTVTFNLLDARGAVVDESIVALEAAAANISLRTGCFCNPGAAQAALGVDRQTLEKLPRSSARSMDDYVEVLGLPSRGAIRVSFGVASTVGDVECFMRFAATFRNRIPNSEGMLKR